MPNPIEVAQAFHSNFKKIIFHTSITMLESIGGFLLGSLFAYFIAICFVLQNRFKELIYPYAIAIKSTPLIVLAPLFVLWFGEGYLSKVIMSSVVCFFPVLVSSYDGLTSIDRDMYAVIKSLSNKKIIYLLKLQIPNSLPLTFSSLKIASSLAVVGSVIGEFSGSRSGVGYLVKNSSYYLDTDISFACILCLSLASIGFFHLISVMESRVIFWNNRIKK